MKPPYINICNRACELIEATHNIIIIIDMEAGYLTINNKLFTDETMGKRDQS